MKTRLPLLLAILLPLAAHAADDLSTALQKGLFEEEANQNLPAAIQAYQALLSASEDQRKLAATALFRLGECHRKLGQTNDAIAQYQRLISDFGDQTTLTTLSRQNLRGLGVSPTVMTSGNDPRAVQSLSSDARAQLKGLLQGEIGIAARFAAEQRKRVETGTLALGEEVRFERDVLGLKRQLVAVDGLSSAEDRHEWRKLLLQEITLAEKAVKLEQQKLDAGKSVASEVARLQRDVLILKREMVTFESTPQSVSTSPVLPSNSIEAEELARTERILAQLSGLDFSQVRRLLPTLVPDADSERFEKLLVDAQERAGQRTGEERDRWLKTEADYTVKLAERFEVIKRRLEDRAAQLRSEVAKESAQQARRETSASGAAQAATAGLRAEAVRADALLKQLQPMNRSELIRVLPTVAPDELLNSLLERLAEAQRNLASTSVAFTSSHPNVKALETTLKNLHEQIAERVNGIMQGLAIKAAALKQQTDEPTGAAAPIDEEDQEIRRIQALIKDSPDLINAPNVEVTRIRSGELMVPKNGTLLHKAASLGQLRVATFLLDHGADVGVRDELGYMPLHWAANNGHRAMTDLLLSRKADPNATLSDGSTSLLLAAKKSFRSVCETLLAGGANPNLANKYGNTPLQEAAEGGDEATLRLLLAKGAEVNPKDYSGSSALHYASSTNVARLLLERGADINAQNDKGQSPLHEKASSGNVELVKLLLENKADAKLKNKDGLTALHLAASEGRASVIEPLIQGGADPNDQESRTSAPLIYAIQKESRSRAGFSDYPATLTALLAGGANPNLPGKDGWTPLYQAASRGFDQMVEMLLKAGADPNLNSGGGYRPIHLALDPGRERMLEALLSHGANADAQNGSGQIPLGRAAEIGSKEAVALLLQYKADPNAKSNQGRTPLHTAVRNNRRDIVDLLLTAKANPNATDAQELSALDYAKQQVQVPRLGFQPGLATPSTMSISTTSPSTAASPDDLADKLRKAGARDWAPRPGQITVTRRITGKTLAVFTKGTNDWNRHSLLETMAFTYLGEGSLFPFPDLSRLTITRQDPASGEIKEFTVNLPAKLAADDCKADFWLEWGDLIDVPEGEHRLDVLWLGLPPEDLHTFGKCVARKVTISVKGKTKEIEFTSPTRWMRQIDGFGVNRNTTDTTFRLRPTVLNSGLLLTSSDTSRVKVKRTDAASGRFQEWTFDLSKEATADDLWLRDGDVIEVPEK